MSKSIWRPRFTSIKAVKPLPHGVPVPTDLSLDEEYLAYLRGCAIPGANLKGLKLVAGLR